MKTFEEIKAQKQLKILQQGLDGFVGSVKDMLFIFSFGGGWEHLSVSKKNSCPTWNEMCGVKNLFWNKDECCVQFHPAESEYVNNHPFCLHIWKPINDILPEPPSWMVGVKRGAL